MAATRAAIPKSGRDGPRGPSLMIASAVTMLTFSRPADIWLGGIQGCEGTDAGDVLRVGSDTMLVPARANAREARDVGEVGRELPTSEQVSDRVTGVAVVALAVRVG